MTWTESLTADDISKMAPDTKAVSLILPSIVEVDEPFALHIAAFRRDGYPHLESDVTVMFENEWHKCTTGDIRGLPASIKLSPSDQGVMNIPDLSFAKPGVYTISAAVDKLPPALAGAPVGIVGSNAVWVMPEVKERVFWGDIHVHSILGNCHTHTAKSPEFLYSFADKVAALDFAAAIDHVENLDHKKWRELYDAAERHYRPGEFVSFLGYEYTSLTNHPQTGYGGHMNVYFAGDKAHEFQDISDHFERIYDEGKRFTIAEIWAILDLWQKKTGGDYLSAVHHTAWDGHMQPQGEPETYDETRMPVIEIFSKWGCSEREGHPHGLWLGVTERSGYTQQLLADGYRFGFIAGSDCHNSTPHGQMGHIESHSGVHTFYEHGGLTGVWAKEKTRSAIFDAIRSRRCFATSYNRIPMDLSINNHVMGTVTERAADEPRHLKATILGTSPTVRVEIVRNGKVIDVQTPKPVDLMLFEIEFKDKDPLESTFLVPPERSNLPPFTYYYVRIRQSMGAMAWSSPIWFTA